MSSPMDVERSRQSGRGRNAQSPSEVPLAGWKDVLWRLYGEVSDDRVMLVAAGVTYYILLAFVPGLTAFISVYGLVLDPGTVSEHVSMLQGIVPGGGMEIIEEQLQRLVSQGDSSLSFALIISVGIALWSANAGMKALFEAMNVAYDEREERSFIRLTAITLCFTLGAIVTIGVMLAVVIVLPAALQFVGLGEGTEWLIRIVSYLLLFCLLSLGIAALYRWGPNRRDAQWRWITPGSLLSLIGTLIISILFTWYTANFGSYDATYGSLGAIVGFMTWMWISLILLILGGELNSELEHQTSADTTVGGDQPMGERGARMADTVGKAYGETGLGTLPGQEKTQPAPTSGRGNDYRIGRAEKISIGTLAVTVPAALLLSWMQRRSARR
ncbi:YihY/virulence factor BrkB family protein [Consotaella aegiceratis]|uniref:YihY/virulence factor BrkB family protein n=1 Tax=Consotaella aegiceratis TaxID=3097961 RepID=UPI002F3E4869